MSSNSDSISNSYNHSDIKQESLLEKQSNKQDDNTTNEPTITCLIIAHGADLNYKINSRIDKNIRLLSRAGVPGCLGRCGTDDYDVIFREYEHKLDSSLSSFQKLEQIQEKFLSEQECALLYDTTNREKYDKRSGKYSLDIFTKKRHSRIFKPFNDHIYEFTWSPKFKQGIHILEVKNPPPDNDIRYRDNLLKKRFHLDEFNNPEKLRYNIEKILRKIFKYMFYHDGNKLDNIINNFVAYFKENNYNSEHIFEMIYEIEHTYKQQYFAKKPLPLEDQESNQKLIDKFYPKVFSNETECLDFIFNIIKYSSKLYVILQDDIYSGNIDTRINMSAIIDYLKSKGYKIINLIDLSCRSIPEEIYEDKELLNELREGEDMGVEDPIDLYNTAKGNSKKFKKNKKSKKNKKFKKYKKFNKSKKK